MRAPPFSVCSSRFSSVTWLPSARSRRQRANAASLCSSSSVASSPKIAAMSASNSVSGRHRRRLVVDGFDGGRSSGGSNDSAQPDAADIPSSTVGSGRQADSAESPRAVRSTSSIAALGDSYSRSWQRRLLCSSREARRDQGVCCHCARRRRVPAPVLGGRNPRSASRHPPACALRPRQAARDPRPARDPARANLRSGGLAQGKIRCASSTCSETVSSSRTVSCSSRMPSAGRP